MAKVFFLSEALCNFWKEEIPPLPEWEIPHNNLLSGPRIIICFYIIIREFRHQVNRDSVSMIPYQLYQQSCSPFWSVLGENFLDRAANRGAIVSEKYLGSQYLNSGQLRRTGELAIGWANDYLKHAINAERDPRNALGKKIQILCISAPAFCRRRYFCSPQQTRFLLPETLLFHDN